MQDWGEIAAATVEGQEDEQMLIVDSNRGRGLTGLPKIFADMWDMHYIKNPSNSGIKGDYGGNIEVTPDNLLVIGDTSTNQMRNLLFNLGYKDKHVILETSWLQVGHVDEYTTYIPNFKAQGGYTIVKSDPGLALDLIRDSSESDINKVNSRYRSSIRNIKDVLLNEKSMLRNRQEFGDYDLTGGNMLEENNIARMGGEDRSAQLVDLNRRIAEVIDRNVELLKARITEFTGGQHNDISVISYPTIFQGRVSGGQLYNSVALLPGSVNMLVLRNNAVVPDAQLPLFNQSIKEASEKEGMVVHFIDTMPYHTLSGQIHCGTNVIRTPEKYHVYPDFIVRKKQFQDFFQEKE
jgi:protein-arginine deiminase